MTQNEHELGQVAFEEFGRAAYEAYDRDMLNGAPGPMTWEETHADVKHAWGAAANAAVQEAMRQCAAKTPADVPATAEACQAAGCAL